MSKTLVFLDDDHQRAKSIRARLPSIIHVETAEDCIKKIDSLSHIKILFLDHDLGGQHFASSMEKNSGMEVVRHLITHDMKDKIELIIVHSLNYPASLEMQKKLRSFGYNVSKIDFLQLHGKYLDSVEEFIKK